MALQAITARTDPDVQPRLEAIVDDLDQTIREVRTAIFALQPTGSTQTSVRRRILDIVGDAAHNLGFEPRLVLDGPIETIDDAATEQLLPTLREALTNVARHARATFVDVTVEVVRDAVRLIVRDDGAGIGRNARAGYGLDNMAQRADSLGGAFVVESGKPSGTNLRWEVPTAATKTG